MGFPTSCLLDFYGAGEDNGGRGTDSPGGRHLNWTNGALTSTTPQGFLQAGCPSCCPTNSVKALKASDNTEPLSLILNTLTTALSVNDLPSNIQGRHLRGGGN